MLKSVSVLVICAGALALGSFVLRAQSHIHDGRDVVRANACAQILKRLSERPHNTWQNRMRAWDCRADLRL